MSWRTVPLRTVILGILDRRQGMLTDKDLVRLLKNQHENVTQAELDRALMELEIEGQIHVQQITKSKRKIERLGNRAYLAIAED